MLMMELFLPDEMMILSAKVTILLIGELNSLKYLYNYCGLYNLRCNEQKKSLCTNINSPIVVPNTMYLLYCAI